MTVELGLQEGTDSGSPLLDAMPAHPLSSRVRDSDNKPISTLPRRWSTGPPENFDSIFTRDGKPDIGVARGVESVGSGEGGKILSGELSGETGVEGRGGRE